MARFDANSISGYVNFPRHLPSSGQGGTFVRLVVLPVFEEDQDAEDTKNWQQCTGGYQHFLFDETFEGDDLTADAYATLGPMPSHPDEVVVWYDKYQAIEDGVVDRYFPNFLKNRGKLTQADCISIPVHAVLTIGSTGWSDGNGWTARRSDLTAEGEALYRSFEALYPGCEIRLLTFLDT